MLAISTFFINISMKMARAKTRDDKRRLKLLYGGTTASLTPLFLLVIVSLIFKQSMEHVSDWIIVPVLVAVVSVPADAGVRDRGGKGDGTERRRFARDCSTALARRGLRLLTVAIVILSLMLVAFRIIVRAGHAASPQQLVDAGGDCRDCGAAADRWPNGCAAGWTGAFSVKPSTWSAC